jgi:hypothetical protein
LATSRGIGVSIKLYVGPPPDILAYIVLAWSPNYNRKALVALAGVIFAFVHQWLQFISGLLGSQDFLLELFALYNS